MVDEQAKANADVQKTEPGKPTTQRDLAQAGVQQSNTQPANAPSEKQDQPPGKPPEKNLLDKSAGTQHCVVCGAGSARVDWHHQQKGASGHIYVACDRHKPSEFSKAVTDAENALASEQKKSATAQKQSQKMPPAPGEPPEPAFKGGPGSPTAQAAQSESKAKQEKSPPKVA